MSKSKDQRIKQKRPRQKRQYTIAPEVIDPGVKCVHCGERYGHVVKNTYPNGRRRRICSACGKPFMAREDRQN